MRLDAAPWFEQAYRRIRPPNGAPWIDDRPVSDKELSRQLGMSRGALILARREGLTFGVADRWALSIGLHPVAIWPAFYADVVPEDVPEFGDLPGENRLVFA